MYYLTPAEGKLNPRKSALKSLLKLGYLGLEPRTYRLKAECSTIELVNLCHNYILILFSFIGINFQID